MTIHLLDYLAYCMGCDLFTLRAQYPWKLQYQIRKIDAGACTDTEWRQCIDYLFPKQSGSRSADAYTLKQQLLALLDSRCATPLVPGGNG